ncbi:6-phosphofructokinase [Aureibacter tunicatorum]|uniref:ATP-dependent 6-phosphofructokinase n=1 Tax=Aureibacter tunicatorum TaxID=866807 RepID=A0AAE3XPY2_9BACT|nr:6-phosphofructokinase [Aureibacter tunicatorum]MDR6239894.1 6-phosphofructokinase 1 [Aureibacter tunicatorum]BDD04369.1 ATP-dependent 6-phosphofructokinase 2 [Aureibacter tunicatorum]
MKKVAVLTSGGDAPGMNACLRAVVRGALYHGLEVYGIKRGYDGMIRGDIYKMKSYSVSNILGQGGTILKSARSVEFRTKEGRAKAAEQLKSRGIEGLVVIGGDGTFTGAKLLYEEHGLPVVGAPGTIDNDLYGTDSTIGYDTAVNTALDAIDKIRDTANSHDRVFFIEVMGRDSGYIAVQTGIGGGAELVMVPETRTTIDNVISTLQQGWDREKSASIVITAEGDQEGSAQEIAAKVKAKCPDKDIKVTTLGHIQRGGSPSAYDRILASRLGLAALEGLVAGKECVMAGIIKNEVVYTSLEDAITKDKPLNQDLVRMINILSV